MSTQPKFNNEKLNVFVGNANGRGLIRLEIENTGKHIASMPRGSASEEYALEIMNRWNTHDELVSALTKCANAINPLLCELRNPDDDVFRAKILAIQTESRIALSRAASPAR